MPDDLISKRPAFERTRIVTRGGEWLFVVSAVVFVLTIVVWGGLFLFKRGLHTNAANWREQVSALERELRPDLLNQLIVLSDKLISSREILTNHVFPSNVFALIERTTHPLVSYDAFQYAADPNVVTLSAKAASYKTVAEQITILEADSQVERVSFGGLTLQDDGLVSFKLSISFKPSLLKLRPAL